MSVRLLLLVSCLCTVIPLAGADPNDLSGGVLITHAASDECVGYLSRYAENACDVWTQWPEACAIESCAEQVNTLPTSGFEGFRLFWVLAAWGEEKQWCGTEFGISPDFNNEWYFFEFGPCLANSIELPTPGWPSAGEGTAIVATDEPWVGDFQPVYFFVGYSYYESLIELDVDPATGFAGFGNCDFPSVAWEAECLGAMGIGDGGGGTYCCPGFSGVDDDDLGEHVSADGPRQLHATPNPSSGAVRLSWSGALAAGSSEPGLVEFLSVDGRVVASHAVNLAQGALVWDGLLGNGLPPSGVYWARLSRGGQVFDQRPVLRVR